jgi:hypothetical protein
LVTVMAVTITITVEGDQHVQKNLGSDRWISLVG